MSRKIIIGICSQAPPSLKNEYLKDLTGEQCEAGLVTGIHAVRKVIRASGTSEDPAQCETDTIRYLCGIKSPIHTNGYFYYRNGIWRAENEAEVTRAIKLFGFS